MGTGRGNRDKMVTVREPRGKCVVTKSDGKACWRKLPCRHKPRK